MTTTTTKSSSPLPLPLPLSLPASTTTMKTMLSEVLESIPAALPAVIPLTESSSSWILHIPKFFPPPTRQVFRDVFKTHPTDRHPLIMFGKQHLENRYSQLFVTDASVGDTYQYSGTSRPCLVCDPQQADQQFVVDLCKVADQLVNTLIDQDVLPRPPQQDTASTSATTPTTTTPSTFYNCSLVNWYDPTHSIGLHADDEKEMNSDVPILSLSWGGPRRFLLRSKPNTVGALSKLVELRLNDGDLLLMGGKCQEEFKHEVPRVRKKDGLVGDRISWTIRSMQPKKRGTKRRRG
jgi:alkylated DNA repair dioxygenase AlkB